MNELETKTEKTTDGALKKNPWRRLPKGGKIAVIVVGILAVLAVLAALYVNGKLDLLRYDDGKNLSMSMTGLQMAAAYTGSTLLSPLFGVLAQNITMKLYPFVLLLMLVLMTVFSEQLHRKTAAKRAGNA